MRRSNLFFLLTALFLVGPARAAVTVQVGTFNVPASQSSLVVPVTVSADQTFASFQCFVQYNTSVLKLTSSDKGGLVSSFNVMSNPNSPGVVKVGGFDPSLKGVSGSGTLLTLTFAVVAPGTSTLSLQNLRMSDAAGKAVPCTGSSGRVQVGDGSSDTSKVPADTTPAATETTPATTGASSGGGYTRSSRFRPGLPVARPDVTTDGARSAGTDIDTRNSLARLPGSQPGRRTTSPTPSAGSSSGSVVLVVKSPYGHPKPPIGITGFSKGDRVECRVETEICLNEKEKMVCTGYDGDGSLSPGRDNTVSFVISSDSKLVWKWVKWPAGKEYPRAKAAAASVQPKRPVPEKHTAAMQVTWSKNKKECMLDISVQPENKTSKNKEKISAFQVELNLPPDLLTLKSISSDSSQYKVFHETEKNKSGVKLTGAFLPSYQGGKPLRLVFIRKKALPKNFAPALLKTTLWNDAGDPIPVLGVRCWGSNLYL